MRKEILMVALGLTSLAGCQTAEEKNQRVDNELQKINQTPTTNTLPVMADCYDISIRPERIEAVDPATGDKVIHVKNGQ
jgi:hypothetical protein